MRPFNERSQSVLDRTSETELLFTLNEIQRLTDEQTQDLSANTTVGQRGIMELLTKHRFNLTEGVVPEANYLELSVIKRRSVEKLVSRLDQDLVLNGQVARFENMLQTIDLDTKDGRQAYQMLLLEIQNHLKSDYAGLMQAQNWFSNWYDIRDKIKVRLVHGLMYRYREDNESMGRAERGTCCKKRSTWSERKGFCW